MCAPLIHAISKGKQGGGSENKRSFFFLTYSAGGPRYSLLPVVEYPEIYSTIHLVSYQMPTSTTILIFFADERDDFMMMGGISLFLDLLFLEYIFYTIKCLHGSRRIIIINNVLQ